MAEKIILQDGTEREVPTADELAAFTKAQQDLATAQAELAKFKDNPADKNWRALNEKADRLKAALIAQGKEVGEDGTVTEKTKMPTFEEIEAKTRSITSEMLLGQQKNTMLSKFDPETKKVVEHYYNKLVTGETVTPENMEKFISEAAKLAIPESATQKGFSVNGQPPRFKTETGSGFGDTDLGKQLAKEIFGVDETKK